MKKSISFILILNCFFVFSQHCTLTISGKLIEATTQTPVSQASIFLQETKVVTESDGEGNFKIYNLCAGEYHLSISHAGCLPLKIFLKLSRDTSLIQLIEHYQTLLQTVTVTDKNNLSTQKKQSLSEHKIAEEGYKNLSNLLENLDGVRSLKSGSGIAKPMIHGLYGNRLLILNNGITQSGQQWGNDHSPEIDPLAAGKISVIKGAEVLEYQGSSLGSIILVEPQKINQEPHLHGKVNYFFESNGLANGLNFQLQQYTEALAWKVTTTFKKSGDRYTPDYFLTNTGSQELNLAIQIERKWTKNWHSDVYFSTFNTILGILRGAHVGNLSDLEEAFTRKEPFFTQNYFSYEYAAPYQKVTHHLLKMHVKNYLSSQKWMDFTYAWQWNDRNEFDVRRGGRSEIPALSIQQLTHFGELKFSYAFDTKHFIKMGVQVRFTDNTNNPQTGILPLIPNYFLFEGGGFIMFSKKHNEFSWETGVRWDKNSQDVWTFHSNTVQNFTTSFDNIGLNSGLAYQANSSLKVRYNIGFISRNPAINELYSNGLHQGLSGIEEGNINLKTEKSFSSHLTVEGRLREKLFLEAHIFFQSIPNYIFLEPQKELRLTIRGAFPVFKYKQTHGRMMGSDISLVYSQNEKWTTTLKYSYLRGDDLTREIPLVLIPSNTFSIRTTLQIPKFAKRTNPEVELNYRYVFAQENLLKSQDFLEPPPAYGIFSVKMGMNFTIKKTILKSTLAIENALDTQYRDYLNRQRYFADEWGRSLILSTSWFF